MTLSENLPGVIFVMIGPGGAGKNAIMKAIISAFPAIEQLATATTRPMRADEMQGREHLFVSEQAFRAMIRKNELLEHQEVTPGKFYGIPRRTVEDVLTAGGARIADIEVLGAIELAAAYPRNVVQVFVTVPGANGEAQLALLEERMRMRADDATDIEQRLERARKLELPYRNRCDYIVVNDDLAGAIERDERHHPARIGRAPAAGRPIMNDLSQYHSSMGARLAPDQIPLDYGDQRAEYEAAENGAILLDRSHEGRILLRGRDRFELVNRMSTNELSQLAPNKGAPTVFINANARILFRASCFNLSRGLLLISEAGQGEALATYLRRNIFFGDQVSVDDISAATVHFALHGNKSDEAVMALASEAQEIPPLHSAEVESEAGDLIVARRKSFCGGHWSVIADRKAAVAIHRLLLRRGAEAGLKPAGSLTFNSLRIRSGRPASPELSLDYIPLEVGLWDEISFSKGCYTGQEIIARMESRGRLAKVLVKIDLASMTPAPAPILAGQKPAGTLTSSVKAADGRVYALAVVKVDSALPGTVLRMGANAVNGIVADFGGVPPPFLIQARAAAGDP